MSHSEEGIAELVANLALNILTHEVAVTRRKTSHHQGVSR
jgi:hypothetical protein